MAYAGALFADACLRGLDGAQGVEEFSYVESDKTELPFFSSRVRLGPNGEPALSSKAFPYSSNNILEHSPNQETLSGKQNTCAGIEEIYGLGKLSSYEEEAVQAAMPELRSSIQKGIDFVHQA